MELILTVKSKADESVKNVRHLLSGPMVLGRGPESPISLEAPGISREHLELQVEGSALFVTDRSSNGTWINGARMPQGRKCKIREADFIELPGYEIQFQLIAAAAPAIVGGGPAANASKQLRPAAFRGLSRSTTGSLGVVDLFALAVAFASVALLVTYLVS